METIFLKLIHEDIDKANSDYGTKEKLCIYCKSNKYEGKQGIIHSQLCIVTLIRDYLKKLEVENGRS